MSYAKILTPFLVVLLAFNTPPVLADNDDSMDDMYKRMQEYRGERMGYGYGMGMMGNGMMGPGGMGMMGNGMMGPGGMGMMGNGMMGSGGMGMMGYGGMSPMMMNMLDLDKKQRSRVRELIREQRASRCKNMDAMMDIADELAEQYYNDKPDAKAIGKTYEKLHAQQRSMIEQSIVTRNRIRDVLNKEQKEQFDNLYRGGGMRGPGGMGVRNMMRGGMMD